MAAVAERRYAVVFMDLQMPLMDGFKATTAIRRLAGAAAATPILALTAPASATNTRAAWRSA